MKKLVLGIVLVFLIFLLSSSGVRKDKYGFVNATEIIQKMPETKEVEKKIFTYKTELETHLKSIENDYLTKLQKYNQDSVSMSPLLREELKKQISALEKDITEFTQKANTDLQAQNKKLLDELKAKFLKAVSEVAEENGYRQIIDNSNGVLLYTLPADDVKVLVEKKLGLK